MQGLLRIQVSLTAIPPRHLGFGSTASPFGGGTTGTTGTSGAFGGGASGTSSGFGTGTGGGTCSPIELCDSPSRFLSDVFSRTKWTCDKKMHGWRMQNLWIRVSIPE